MFDLCEMISRKAHIQATLLIPPLDQELLHLDRCFAWKLDLHMISADSEP